MLLRSHIAVASHCSSDLTPSLGTSICLRCCPKGGKKNWVQLQSRAGERWPSDQLWFKAVHVDLTQEILFTGPAEFTWVENRSTAGDKGCVPWEEFLI